MTLFYGVYYLKKLGKSGIFTYSGFFTLDNQEFSWDFIGTIRQILAKVNQAKVNFENF